MNAECLPSRRGLPLFRVTPQLTWTVWVLFLSVVVVGVLITKRQGVFPIFDHAGRCWLEGHRLYQRTPGLDQFLYAPVVAAFFAPLSLLPERVVGVLWRLSGLAFFGFAFFRYLRMLQLDSNIQTISTLWLLMLPLLGGSIHNGQTNLFLLGLLLAGVVAVSENRYWLAALCFGITGLLKIYPLFLAGIIALRSPRVFTYRLAIVLLAGLTLPFLLHRPDYALAAYLDWFDIVAKQDRTHWALERAPRDLALLMRLTGDPLPASIYRLIQFGMTLAITLLCFRVCRRRDEDAEETGIMPQTQQRRFLHTALTLSCCWMLTLGPAAESCTFCLLAPSLALCLICDEEKYARRRTSAWITYCLLAFAAVACWLPTGKHFAGVIQPLAGLMFLATRIGWAFDLATRQTKPTAKWNRHMLDTKVIFGRKGKPCEAMSV